jgi:hypothetical protein
LIHNYRGGALAALAIWKQGEYGSETKVNGDHNVALIGLAVTALLACIHAGSRAERASPTIESGN